MQEILKELSDLKEEKIQLEAQFENEKEVFKEISRLKMEMESLKKRLRGLSAMGITSKRVKLNTLKSLKIKRKKKNCNVNGKRCNKTGRYCKTL